MDRSNQHPRTELRGRCFRVVVDGSSSSSSGRVVGELHPHGGIPSGRACTPDTL